MEHVICLVTLVPEVLSSDKRRRNDSWIFHLSIHRDYKFVRLKPALCGVCPYWLSCLPLISRKLEWLVRLKQHADIIVYACAIPKRCNSPLTNRLISYIYILGISKSVVIDTFITLQWRHNERDGVSIDRRLDCLLNRLFQAQIKENIEAPRHWPLWGDTGDHGIPLTKGQKRGKWFHLMIIMIFRCWIIGGGWRDSGC